MDLDHLAGMVLVRSLHFLSPSSLHTEILEGSHYTQSHLKEWGVMLDLLEEEVATYIILNCSIQDVCHLPTYLFNYSSKYGHRIFILYLGYNIIINKLLLYLLDIFYTII